jgi:putative heme-binding domain-containing protein
MFCHSRAAGFVLGLNPSQMNRDHRYGGIVDNQIRAFDHAGVFKTPATDLTKLPRFVDPYDPKADLDERARTYLHVNCSICHVSDGGGNSFIELNHGRKLADTGALGNKPVQGSFGLADPRIIAPGDPDGSVLIYRVASTGGARMPRVGSRVVDESAVAMLTRWIARMPIDKESPETKSQRDETAAQLARLQEAGKSTPAQLSNAMARLLGTTRGALALAGRLGRGTLPETVREEVLTATRDHPSTEVRDLFERFLPETERIARLGDRVDPQQVLSLTGDSRRGRALFAADSAVNCKSCHRLDGAGVEIGPDLAALKTRYPRAELLRQILEPSLYVDPKFTVHHVVTHAGLVHVGLIVERNDRAVVLRDAKNQTVRVAASDIEDIAPQRSSLMPDGLLRGLTAQQGADLLSYLISLQEMR